MKKILLSLFVLAVTGFAAKVQAQCTVSNLNIQPISFDANTCTATFNIQFDQEVNSGNKFAYIHFWTNAAYHTPGAAWTGIYSGPSKFPEAAQLVNALFTISIEFNGTSTPSIMATYLPDPTVTTLTSGLTITKIILPGGTTERQTISGLSVVIPGCAGANTLKGDIWASQAANGKNVHCATQGLTFNLTNPVIVGAQKICTPRRIVFGVKNEGAANIDVEYRIYVDNNVKGFFDPGNTDGNAIYTAQILGIAPGATSGVSLTSAEIAALGVGGEAGDYWIEVDLLGGSFSTLALVKHTNAGCAPLPVSFTMFKAARQNNNVNLIWQTSYELNNTGFYVERNVSGNWEPVGFVPSQGLNGASNDLLNYTFVDANNIKGITQYRLRQVDFDGKTKYSEIRSVRGEGQPVKLTIYPNPSVDGKVNIVFDDANAVRNISVMDMSGRIVRQINSVTNNNITIENLQPGMYTVRVMVPETGAVGVEKIIVNKR